jgi:hypothetical protein
MFLGKRAFASYWMMFVHECVLKEKAGGGATGKDGGVGAVGDLAEFLDGLSNSLGVGREVGMRWGWVSVELLLLGIGSRLL